MLTFEEAAHVYRWNGRPVPSVTEIIRIGSGVPDNQWIPDSALQRGSAVHKACHFIDTPEEGLVDWATIDPKLQPYICAYQDFLVKAAPGIVYSEKALYEPTYKYAGTLDRVYMLGGKLSLIDLKCNMVPPLAGEQLAGYAKLLETLELFIPPEDRFILVLKKSGKPQLKRAPLTYDGWLRFQCCLVNYRAKQKENA